MGTLGRILLADDQDTFLQSTADLLRREGYDCDCVTDATAGIEKLRNNKYDLLISDIEMPGNPNLDLVCQLSGIARGTSAIIVTGYPSQRSAIQAVGLPVVAYMLKPLDFEKLLTQVEAAIEKAHLYRAVVSARHRLQYWQQSLTGLEEVLKDSNAPLSSEPTKDFLDLTFANIEGALSDVKHITAATTSELTELPVCHLLNCPRLVELTAAMDETIKVMEKTKSAFKSKELGQMRKKLQQLVENSRNN